jgi:Peptidase family M41
MADCTDSLEKILLGTSRPQRPQTQWLIDQEVQHIVDTAHKQVSELLTEHRAQLESLARALLAAETLDTADAYAAAKTLAEVAESEAATAQDAWPDGDSLRRRLRKRPPPTMNVPERGASLRSPSSGAAIDGRTRSARAARRRFYRER